MQDIERKIRILEDRITTIRQIVNNLELNILNINEELAKKIQNIENEIISLRKDINDIKIKIQAILDQLPSFAQKEQLETIERYLDYLDPFNFLTKKEAEELINKIVDEKVKQILKNIEER